MNITITLNGNKSQHTTSIRLRTLVSMTVLTSLFFLVSSRSTESNSEDLARIQLAQQQIQNDQTHLAEVEKKTDAQINALVAQLSVLLNELENVDRKSEKIADSLGMQMGDLNVFEPAPLAQEEYYSRSIEHEIEQAKLSLKDKQVQLNVLENLVNGRHLYDQANISGKPIESGWLSSYYGMRADPFTGKPTMHKGIDFAGVEGTNVVATAAGIVTWAGKRYGYGQLVEINHGAGLVTRYGHNKKVQVKIGDVVTKGDIIAKMGNTGRSTGAHVHYEVIRNGQPVDPLPYLN